MSAWRRKAIKALPRYRLIIDKAKSLSELTSALSDVLIAETRLDTVDENLLKALFTYLFRQYKYAPTSKEDNETFQKVLSNEYVWERLHKWTDETDFDLLEVNSDPKDKVNFTSVKESFFKYVETDMSVPWRAALYHLRNSLLADAPEKDRISILETWAGVVEFIEVGECIVALENFHDNLFNYFDTLTEFQISKLKEAYDYFEKPFPKRSVSTQEFSCPKSS